MIKLPAYDRDLLVDKIGRYPIFEGDLDKVSLWWQESATKMAWVERFQRVISLLPKGSPEKSDAIRAFAGCDEMMEEANSLLNALLERKYVEGVLGFFVEPYLKFFRVRKEMRNLDRLVELIEKWNDRYWTTEMDQILVDCEVMVEGLRIESATEMRLEIAQQVFEEMIQLFPMQKLAHLFEDIDEQTTIDEMEIEKMELMDAVRGDPWRSEEREQYRRIYKRLRHVMDEFDFETEVKRGFTMAFAYATGHIGKTVSSIDILQNGEKTWQGIKDDSTLQEFWDYEQEKLDDASEEDSEE